MTRGGIYQAAGKKVAGRAPAELEGFDIAGGGGRMAMEPQKVGSEVGAGEGNRTLISSLGSSHSAIELHPLAEEVWH
jgi:hypothetical protein